MISLSRTTSEIPEVIGIHCKISLIFLIIFCYTFPIYGGIQILKSFNDTTDHLNINFKNEKLSLNDSSGLLLKVYGDSIRNAGINNIFPEVISYGKDTFQFFFATQTTNRILKSSVRVTPTSAVSDNSPTKFTDYNPFGVTYLHADRGKSQTMISFLQKITGGVGLTVRNEYTYLDIDSSQGMDYIGSSQCFMEDDTFLVINSVNLNKINLRKIFVQNNNITIAKEIIVSQDIQKLSNCSVCFDNDDAVLAVWSRGELDQPRQLRYCFYNRNLTDGISGVLGEMVCDDSLYNYDDVSIVSYGPARFAVIFWNSSGVSMYQLTRNGGSVQHTLKPVFQKSNIRFSTASIYDSNLVIVANGDIDNDGISGIEGEVFKINGNGTLVSKRKISFSNVLASPINKMTHYSTAINCAIDSIGNIGVIWRDSSSVLGCVWANRGIKYNKGYWTSSIYAMSESENDSIKIYPPIVYRSDLNQDNWFLEDSIRVGSNLVQTVNGAWQSFSNDTILTTDRFFQFRVSLNRKVNRDSLRTPVIDSVRLNWDIKPKFNSYDSVKIGTKTEYTVSFGDTVQLLSRIDSARIFIGVMDPDQSDNISLRGHGVCEAAIKSITTGPLYKTSIKIPPIMRSDTVSSCTFTAWDKQNWYATPVNIFLKTNNSIPYLNVGVMTHVAGITDSFSFPLNSTIILQEKDSVSFVYSVYDTNDPITCKSYLKLENSAILSLMDSTAMGSEKKFCLSENERLYVDTVKVLLSAKDEDTTIELSTRVLFNHSPQILYCIINGDTVNNNDTVRVSIRDENILNVAVSDTDCYFWDSLVYILSINGQKKITGSKQCSIQYSFTPQRFDSIMTVVVSDKFEKKDTIRFCLKYPWLETDTTISNEYTVVLKDLLSGPSLVIGDGLGYDTQLPLHNSGNDSMAFTGINFKVDSRKWFSVSIMQENGYRSFNSTNYTEFRTVVLPPDSTQWVRFTFIDSLMRGDSVVYDTLILLTSDPSHPQLIIPVRMEYNDLPRVLSVEPWFASDIPFTGLAKQRTYRSYWFPPHASVSMLFSEPLDTASAIRGISVYSVLDSIQTGTAQPIDLKYYWSQNYTKLDIRPVYRIRSARFNVLPPEGLFIPTDSVRIRLNPNLTDRATTPHGPNKLDVNSDFFRDTTDDTAFGMTVDSITFSLLSVSPSPGDTSIETKPEITLLFNAPVYAASVDTALINNKTLSVFSRYNDGLAIPYDSVIIDSNKVKFFLGRTLFYYDSLWCRFRDFSIRDRMGFPSDNNNDGIAVSLFDTNLTNDDVFWRYRVKGIRVVAVSPDSSDNVKDVSPLIKISFSEQLPEGIFDFSASNNRSLHIKSKFSSDSISFRSIQVGSDKRSIEFIPQEKFFSNDSVHCYFNGFNRNHRYSQEINLPSDQNSTFASIDWHFHTGYIGFYTFPNPYKPGKNKQHCSDNGPCGIWFKNLHVLKSGIFSVRIVIYSINAHPVYDSQKAGVTIQFGLKESEGRPQWLWDTRNQYGDLIASGLYFYVIYDLNSNVLMKGKLIIVR